MYERLFAIQEVAGSIPAVKSVGRRTDHTLRFFIIVIRTISSRVQLLTLLSHIILYYFQTKVTLEDRTEHLTTARASLEAARHELAELQRGNSELQRLRAAREAVHERGQAAQAEADRLRADLHQLRADMASGRETRLDGTGFDSLLRKDNIQRHDKNTTKLPHPRLPNTNESELGPSD